MTVILCQRSALIINPLLNGFKEGSKSDLLDAGIHKNWDIFINLVSITL